MDSAVNILLRNYRQHHSVIIRRIPSKYKPRFVRRCVNITEISVDINVGILVKGATMPSEVDLRQP